MPAIAVSAKILTVNSYGDKTVSTALTCFSLIRNNTTPVKEHLPHTSLELSNMFSQKFKEILGYSMFLFASFYFWFSYLVLHRLTPALPGPIPEYLYLQKGLLLPFPHCE